MWKSPACQTLLKALDILSATARGSPDLLKALAILLDSTVRKSVIDREDLKPYWKSEKRPHFPRWSTILLFRSFSKSLLTTERRPSNNLENKTPSGTYWRVQLVCVKVQTHNSVELPLEYNQDQTALMNEGSLWPF